MGHIQSSHSQINPIRVPVMVRVVQCSNPGEGMDVRVWDYLIFSSLGDFL